MYVEGAYNLLVIETEKVPYKWLIDKEVYDK